MVRGRFCAGLSRRQQPGPVLSLYSAALGLSAEQQQALSAGRIRLEFLPYDWGLNR